MRRWRPSPQFEALCDVAGSADLDSIALTRMITRAPGETDADLRDRILGREVVRTVEEDA